MAITGVSNKHARIVVHTLPEDGRDLSAAESDVSGAMGVRLYLGAMHEDFVDVSIREGRDGRPCVYVNGGSAIEVRPEVTVYVGPSWAHGSDGIGAWNGPPSVPTIPLDTLLHEVAHVLVGRELTVARGAPGCSHGPKFRTCLARLREDWRAAHPLDLRGGSMDGRDAATDAEDAAAATDEPGAAVVATAAEHRAACEDGDDGDDANGGGCSDGGDEDEGR